MYNYTRRAYLNIPRFLWDVVFSLSAFPLAVLAVRVIHPGYEWMPLLWMPLLYGMVFLFCMNGNGLYEAATFTYQDRTLRGVTASCLCASAMSVVFMFFMPHVNGNTDILAFYSLFGVIIMGLRYLITLASGSRANRRSESQMLLAGSPQQMREYLFYLDKTSFRVNPVGFLSDDPTDIVRDLPRLGSLDDLNLVLTKNVIDEVVLAWPQEDSGRAAPLFRECTRRGIVTKVAMDIWDAEATKCHVHSVGPIPVLIYHRTSLSSVQQYMKRFFDILFGFTGIFLAIVVGILLYPFIRLQSKGTVLVKVSRTGLNGRNFQQLLFRITKPGCTVLSDSKDSMTGVGRFLYFSRLYALPTFWNVFSGSMSLVGTHGSLLNAQNEDNQRRVALKPGMTGLWHVRDFDNAMDEAGLMQLDNEYMDRWSLGMDLRILLLTPLIHLIHRIIGSEIEGDDKA